MKDKTILLGLNELNFDFIKFYINKGLLPNLGKLFSDNKIIETTSEKEYKLLEPWIQWVTIHTGKGYDEHQIFRLGDIVEHKDLPQIFEELEAKGKTIGAISPFNADNRLKKPLFFVPDPWTKTKVSGGVLVEKIYEAIHQSVNDNAQSKLQFKTLLTIGLGVLLNVPISRWGHYLGAFSNRKKPGMKAVVLDSLLTDIFFSMWKKNKPDFSNLFLNSGAHIQHHYLFNSSAYDGDYSNPEWYCPKGYDPLIEILKEYDDTVGRLMKLPNVNLIVATGLHQQPHKHLTFYWRLKKHEGFLHQIGLTKYTSVLPRMSRDFLIDFASEQDAKDAQLLLESFVCEQDDEAIFEVDNRGKSLFVELRYASDLDNDMSIYSSLADVKVSQFKNHVAFVAIKNGEHNGIGYLVSNTDLKVQDKQIPLKEVKNLIIKQVMNENH